MSNINNDKAKNSYHKQIESQEAQLLCQNKMAK